MKDQHEDLIHRYLDGTLTAGEASKLNQLIKNDPKFADRLAEIALLHHSLGSGFRSGSLPLRSGHPNTHEHRPDRKPLLSLVRPLLPWGLAAAAAVIAMVVLNDSTEEPSPAMAGNAPEVTEIRDTGFAVLTHVVDPIWGGSTTPTRGDILNEGLLELDEGLIQIEFFSGVSLVVEGRAALEIISPDEMRLVEGKLRAHVPTPAIGFQIHTPRGTVLDLGTEFALDFSEGEGELHVIDGEVEWHEDAQSEVLLTKGKALKISDEQTDRISASPNRFTSSSDLAAKVISHQNQRFSEWQNHSNDLKGHPRLLAYFPMEQSDSWSRQLAAVPGNIPPGAIVAARSVEGRWPQKQALDFSPNGSRVRVNIPGDHKALTFSTWARIDSLDRQYNALFLTDNYNKGEPHWQLTENGQLFFSVGLGKGPGKFHHVFLSPVIWDHADSERWLHLVTTYDVESRTCVHYLNGEEISRDQAAPEKGVPAITIGSAQIGNWGLPTREEPDFAVRNLNGRLDEFTIFSSALSPEEVHTLYQAGKP